MISSGGAVTTSEGAAMTGVARSCNFRVRADPAWVNRPRRRYPNADVRLASALVCSGRVKRRAAFILSLSAFGPNADGETHLSIIPLSGVKRS